MYHNLGVYINLLSIVLSLDVPDNYLIVQLTLQLWSQITYKVTKRKKTMITAANIQLGHVRTAEI